MAHIISETVSMQAVFWQVFKPAYSAKALGPPEAQPWDLRYLTTLKADTAFLLHKVWQLCKLAPKFCDGCLTV